MDVINQATTLLVDNSLNTSIDLSEQLVSFKQQVSSRQGHQLFVSRMQCQRYGDQLNKQLASIQADRKQIIDLQGKLQELLATSNDSKQQFQCGNLIAQLNMLDHSLQEQSQMLTKLLNVDLPLIKSLIGIQGVMINVN